jgi:hypothetical protein
MATHKLKPSGVMDAAAQLPEQDCLTLRQRLFIIGGVWASAADASSAHSITHGSGNNCICHWQPQMLLVQLSA